MDGRPILLIHGPLVGPSIWDNLLAVAHTAGYDPKAPDLTDFVAAPRPRWTAYIDTSVSAAEGLDDMIVVGHSGAGALLPVIADRMSERVAALIFVDAIHPVSAGLHQPSSRQVELLDGQTTDRRLARWLDWWPSSVVEQLVPSPGDRAAIARDMPTLPRDTYDDPIRMPAEWTDRPCAYLQLSEGYAADRDRADVLGWPTISLDSTHLGIVTEPERTMRAIDELVDRLGV